MNRTFLALALVAGAFAVQPAMAEVFLGKGNFVDYNNSVGTTLGPSLLTETSDGMLTERMRVLSLPAVIDPDNTNRVIMTTKKFRGLGAACAAPVVVRERAAVIVQPAVITCPVVCPPSSNIIIDGTSAPTLIDI